MLNYGWVYPQTLLIFTITLVYSVVSPLILVFGALYFGVACRPRFKDLGSADVQTSYTSTNSSSSTSSRTSRTAKLGGSPLPVYCGR